MFINLTRLKQHDFDIEIRIVLINVVNKIKLVIIEFKPFYFWRIKFDAPNCGVVNMLLASHLVLLKLVKSKWSFLEFGYWYDIYLTVMLLIWYEQAIYYCWILWMVKLIKCYVFMLCCILWMGNAEGSPSGSALGDPGGLILLLVPRAIPCAPMRMGLVFRWAFFSSCCYQFHFFCLPLVHSPVFFFFLISLIPTLYSVPSIGYMSSFTEWAMCIYFIMYMYVYFVG